MNTRSVKSEHAHNLSTTLPNASQFDSSFHSRVPPVSLHYPSVSLEPEDLPFPHVESPLSNTPSSSSSSSAAFPLSDKPSTPAIPPYAPPIPTNGYHQQLQPYPSIPSTSSSSIAPTHFHHPSNQHTIPPHPHQIPPHQHTIPPPHISTPSSFALIPVPNSNHHNIALSKPTKTIQKKGSSRSRSSKTIKKVKVGKGGKYVDITPYLNLPQKEAARRLGLPTSTLSKKWKDAVVKERKWPYRTVSKLDKEIMVLLHNIPPAERSQLPPDIAEALQELLRKRQESLKPVVINM